MTTNCVITIDGEYDTNIRSLGKRMAEILDVDYFDEAVLTDSSEEEETAFDRFHHEQLAAAIRSAAKEGLCVIVGGGADAILPPDYDVISVFLSASMESRISRVAEKNGITPRESQAKIICMDKDRASFYNAISNKKWGNAESYDLCLNSSTMSEEFMGEVLLAYVIQRWGESVNQR